MWEIQHFPGEMIVIMTKVMCSQMAFTKGVLGTLSRGTRLDSSRNLSDEMLAIYFNIHIETLLISLLSLPSSGSLEYNFLNSQ